MSGSCLMFYERILSLGTPGHDRLGERRVLYRKILLFYIH
jgi:hypothetical protein